MSKTVKILLGIVVIGLLAALMVYFFIYNKPHTNYEKAKTDVEITAENLYQSYVNDQSNAEQTFNGKVIEVTGKLDGLEEVEEMVIAVFALSEGMFGKEGIRCTMLPNHQETVRSMKSGDMITLKGFCAGFSGSDVIMEECSVIQ